MLNTNCFEECWLWIKEKYAPEEVAEERLKRKFERETKPTLEKGEIFEWKQETNKIEEKSLSSAISLLTSTILSSSSTTFVKEQKVLFSLVLPKKETKNILNSIGDTVIMKTIGSFDDSTCFVYTSLELTNNKPKYFGKIPLHFIQNVKLIKEKNILLLLDHHNQILFEGRSDSSANIWYELINETRKVLAPQIEEESAAYNGVNYRAKKLELLQERQKEREERKKKMGTVPMVYTAKAMMAKE